MTDPDLSELLERAGERTHVGPPPIASMVAGASRTRRSRTLMLAAGASAAVLLMAGGATVLTTLGGNAPQSPTLAGSPSPRLSAPAEVPPAGSVEGTWTVDALVGKNGQSVLPDSARNELRLTLSDGKLTGTTGCNSVFGTYERGGDDGRDLHFPHPDLGSTTKDCADEPPLVSRLLDVRHVSGSGAVRQLHAENWMIIAVLRRPQESPVAGCRGASPADCGATPSSESTHSAAGVRVTVPSHCGVLSVWIDDELWLANPPLGDHNPPPGWDENETPGTFVVTAPRRAEFHGDGGQKALFRLADPGVADPNAGCE
jgi:heat shock protein HslJ